MGEPGPREGAGFDAGRFVEAGPAWCFPLDRTHSAKRYQGHVVPSLIVGGVDFTGPQLYSVPHGSYSRLPFHGPG